MKADYSFVGTVEKFPGVGGWTYVAVPKKYTVELKKQRRAWGVYPITAQVGGTSWKTKLMMKKEGDFFVALKVDIRKKEKIVICGKVKVSFKLD